MGQTLITFLFDLVASFAAGIIVHKMFANQEKKLMKQSVREVASL